MDLIFKDFERTHVFIKSAQFRAVFRLEPFENKIN